MFGEALLESAPTLRRRKRWPIATAFTLELIVATVLVVLPLMSTGVIPLKATVIVPTPQYTPLERSEPVHRSGGNTGVSIPVARVVPVSTSAPTFGPVLKDTPEPTNEPFLNPEGSGPGKPSSGPDLGFKGTPITLPPPRRPPIISHTTEAMLLTKVVPEYPMIARISGLQGEVKLHAFVDRNGNIESLTVLGNPPPVFAKAALDAVKQWKYRPYVLNGEPVEIETFITVTFRKAS